MCAAAFGPFSFIAASSAYGAVQESDPRDRSGNPQPNITEWSTTPFHRHQYYIYGDLCLRIKLSPQQLLLGGHRRVVYVYDYSAD